MESYEIPEDLLYTREHEWARAEGDRIIIGVTDYAQKELGDVVFVELPGIGSEVTKGDPFGVIESVKAVSDLFAPATGQVVELNEELAERPEAVNEDCYGDGWVIAIAVEDGSELESLLDADSYRSLLRELKG